MDFRQNVAAIIVNDRDLILVGERADIPGSWQLPQGGVDAGEETEKAIFREVMEETGIAQEKLEIVRKTDEIRYVFPKEIEQKMGFKGQCQIFFLLKLTDKNCNPQISDEFSSFDWITRDKVIEKIIEFKKDSYIEAFRQIFGD